MSSQEGSRTDNGIPMLACFADEALETCWFDEKTARGLVAKLTR